MRGGLNVKCGGFLLSEARALRGGGDRMAWRSEMARVTRVYVLCFMLCCVRCAVCAVCSVCLCDLKGKRVRVYIVRYARVHVLKDVRVRNAVATTHTYTLTVHGIDGFVV